MTQKTSENQLLFKNDIARFFFGKQGDQPSVSILTVNYHSEAKIKRMVDSFEGSSIPFEVVVVNNSIHNRGFGAATNLASQQAKGDYFFILNPDVIGQSSTLTQLVDQSKKYNDTVCLAPQLLSASKKPYLSTTAKLGWKEMIVAHSVLNKLWRNNPISAHFWYDQYPLSQSRFVENASGAALFLHKSLFKKVNGFDEKFFLYFEDNDFCNRLHQAGVRIWFAANISVIHEQAGATPNAKKAKTFFKRSRWLYSKKYFGLLPACFSEAWLRTLELFSRQ